MGIQGLLPFLANSTKDSHINEFDNQYVAVDAYCWLHRGIYSCAYELAVKKPTTKYVTYCMRYIEMLKHFKVKPILVFDGRNLSSKEETEKKRREERKKKHKKGLELIRAGKTSEGRQLLGESVDVGHELVINLIKECRKLNIDCIVAPFEADAQLSYLSRQKVVACVISEDSDLLVYGCERVMFKMDKSGRGKLIEKNNIYMSLGMEPEEFTEEKFRYMCILSGCDYLPSLPSIGPANALKFVKLLNNKNIFEVLPRLPIYLNKNKIIVNPDYIAGFKVADNTFKHQLVYDPFQRKQVPLTPAENEDDIVGEKLPENVAFQLAIGNIDPISMKKVDHFDPDELGQGFDILWKSTLLSSDALKENIFNLSHLQNGKRHSEVTLIKPDIKKYCTSSSHTSKSKSLIRRHTISNVPLSGFLFKTDNKSITDDESESNFLKSRYFGAEKNISKEYVIRKEPEKDGGRKKNETYEEYLRRIYEEQNLANENGVDNKFSQQKNNSSDDFLVDDPFKASTLATPTKENPSQLEKNRNTNLNNHSLLDEISKEEKKTLSCNGLPRSLKDENTEVDKISSLEISRFINELPEIQNLRVHSPTQSSIIEDLENKCKKPDFEKIIENKGEEDIGKTEVPNSFQRSISPVFRILKRSKHSKDSFRLENISSTTNTQTSIYFSPEFNNLNDSTISIKSSPVSSKKSGVSRSSTKTYKNNCKSLPSTCTLFQFGFKKENKDILHAG